MGVHVDEYLAVLARAKTLFETKVGMVTGVAVRARGPWRPGLSQGSPRQHTGQPRRGLPGPDCCLVDVMSRVTAGAYRAAAHADAWRGPRVVARGGQHRAVPAAGRRF